MKSTVLLAMALAHMASWVRGDEPSKSSASDPSFMALLVDQTRVEGKLGAVSFGPQTNSLTIASEPPLTLGLMDLVRLNRVGGVPSSSTIPPAAALVILPEGDRLWAKVGSADATSVEISPLLSPGQVVRVPLDKLLGLIFSPPAEKKLLLETIQAIRDVKRAGEQILLANGDSKEGSFLGLDANQIQFDSGAGQVALERTNVTALGFDPALAAYPETDRPSLEVVFTDGSKLAVTACRLEQGQLIFKTRFDAEFAAPLASMVSATVLNGAVSYVAGRTPDATQYVPYLDRHPERYGRDETWDGFPIRLGDQVYDRGLGTLPRTLLAYRLEPGDLRFQALLGQDARAGELASVVFRILVDRKEVFVSPAVTRRDAPISVDLDIAGARLLILITDFGDRGDVQDIADWADARIIRSKPLPSK